MTHTDWKGRAGARTGTGSMARSTKATRATKDGVGGVGNQPGTSKSSHPRMYFDLQLAKFFAMPPGKKAPPQQSSLIELWASKPKKQSDPAASATTATSSGHP